MSDLNDSEYEDPGFGEGSPTGTSSLTSSIVTYPEENGRSYHAYRRGRYFRPNDKYEQAIMREQHEIMLMLTGLYNAPIEDPRSILDLGAGCGRWAIAVADIYPAAEVFGVDLSPIQPIWVPPNLQFYVDDVEEEWNWEPDQFDFIKCQLLLSGSIDNFPKLFAQAFRHCKPGGYFEICDLDMELRSFCPKVPENVQEWCRLMSEGIVGFGNRTLNLDADEIVEEMKGVGFVDVVCKHFVLPYGGWFKDIFHLGLEGYSLAVFTRYLGWSKPELEVFLAKVRAEVTSNSRLHSKGTIIYGRKPGEGR